MEFGPISLAGGILVALMLVPNLIYALRTPQAENKCGSKWINGVEQLGRYASMALMVLPLGAGEFGFPGVADMLVYLAGNGILLAAYWIGWFAYFRRPAAWKALVLAGIPTGIFLLSGLTLRHWLLVLAGIVFGTAHSYITWKNQ